MIFLYIIAANLLTSLISILLAYVLSIKDGFLHKGSVYLISLSAGTLLGGAFLHLLPEAVEIAENPGNVLTITMITILGFLALEKFLNWRHCHKDDCDVHSFGYMNLVGDGVHNFLDGLIIASAFTADVRLGIVATLAIALHEIPQEIGDFGVLIHAGMQKKQALLLNMLISFTALVGGMLGYFAAETMESAEQFLLALAAGGFIYVSTSDLIPEIRGKEHRDKMLISFSLLCAGVVIMWLIAGIE